MEYYVKEQWEAYKKRIVSSQAFKGMPDLYNADGSIQWEAPSNRKGTGSHVHTHQRRRDWWEAKAKSIRIDVDSPKWISRTAKSIHPTKMKTCKKCGLDMDIRYVYPSSRLSNKLRELPFLGEVLDNPFTSIYDIAKLIYLNHQDAPKLIQSLLKTKAITQVPVHDSFEELKRWLDEVYVPAEPTTLSPGAMSNAPDRLDGFHSFNRCCRSTADKGRSRENLAAYSTDRRAFENWTGGNWVTSNQLMGLFQQLPLLREQPCANQSLMLDAAHNSGATADHIGPISLGFAHRPVFRVLCKSCNSAKNARMTQQDFAQLLKDEASGENICSWYLQPIWDFGKNERFINNSVHSFNRMLRDNRDFAFYLLTDLHSKEHFLALSTLLSFEYGLNKWEPIKESVRIVDSIATSDFTSTKSEVKYRSTQLNRYLRVSFESLTQYAVKTSRNTATNVDFLNIPDITDIELAAHALEARYPELAKSIKDSVLAKSNLTLADFKALIEIQSAAEAKAFRDELTVYMKQVASAIWNNRLQDRYTRIANPNDAT